MDHNISDDTSAGKETALHPPSSITPKEEARKQWTFVTIEVQLMNDVRRANSR